MSNLDYAHPIRDNTREEIFAVPVCSLFNINIALLKYMQRNMDIYGERYPFIKFIDVSEEKSFFLTEFYSEWEFMMYLKYGDEMRKYSYEDFMNECGDEYVDIRMKWDPIQDAIPTNFFGAIAHLLTIGVITRLYIYDSIGKYDKAIQALVVTSFGLQYEKHYDVQMLNCENGVELYKSNYFEEITTFVLDSNEDLYQILKDMKENHPEYFKVKYFILPKLRLSNYSEESVKAMSPTYWILKHSDFYMELEKNREFSVGYYLATPM